MNCNDLDAYLVDFLGGELEPSAVQSIETHLQNCPACAAEVDGLRGVMAALDATRLSPETVAEMAQNAPLTAGSPQNRGNVAATRPPLRIRVLSGVLRYAAVIAFAFYIGWWYRGDTAGATAPNGGSGSTAPALLDGSSPGWRAEAVSPKVAAGFEAASEAFPRSSSFSRSLLAFSRR